MNNRNFKAFVTTLIIGSGGASLLVAILSPSAPVAAAPAPAAQSAGHYRPQQPAAQQQRVISEETYVLTGASVDGERYPAGAKSAILHLTVVRNGDGYALHNIDTSLGTYKF